MWNPGRLWTLSNPPSVPHLNTPAKLGIAPWQSNRVRTLRGSRNALCASPSGPWTMEPCCSRLACRACHRGVLTSARSYTCQWRIQSLTTPPHPTKADYQLWTQESQNSAYIPKTCTKRLARRFRPWCIAKFGWIFYCLLIGTCRRTWIRDTESLFNGPWVNSCKYSVNHT